MANRLHSDTNISAVEAQRLIIHILKAISPETNIWIYTKMNDNEENLPKDVFQFLELCIKVSSELRENPQCYDSLEKICIAILRRQTNHDTISKKQYGEALGIRNRVQRLRVEKGEASLSLNQIRHICSGFRDPIWRQFWENQLLGLYPEAADVGRANTFEVAVLEWLYKALKKLELFEDISNHLDMLDRQRLDDLFSMSSDKTSSENRFGDKPDKLFSVINYLAAQKNMMIPDIAEEEVCIHVNTWYTWRKNWDEAENCGFKYGIPKNRLSRVQIMILSVLFELNYLESVSFMALSGYWYVSGEPDDEVLKCLFNLPEAKSPVDIRKYLREGMYIGKW